MPPQAEPKMRASEPKKDTARETREAVVEDADKTEGMDRNLEHGDGGTLNLPKTPDDLNHAD